MQYVIAMHLLRWQTIFYHFSFKWTATAAIGIHPTKAWLSQQVNFKNAIWTWGHFRRTICKHSSNRVSGISTRTMHQSTTPSLSQTIWPKWASRQFVPLPIVKTCSLWLLAIQRLSLWDNWEDERGCDEVHWYPLTRRLPWGLPEVVGTVKQVHFSRRRLLWRWLVSCVYYQ